MKKTDLKPGALLAAKHISGPVRLLSTDLFTRQYGGRVGQIKRASEYVTKPKAAPKSRSFGFDVEDHGYLVLKTSPYALRDGVDAEQAVRTCTLLADDLIGEGGVLDKGRVPEGCEVAVVTSLAALLGDYDVHVRDVEEQRQRDQDRRTAEERRHLAIVDRHNRLAAALSTVLDMPIHAVDEYAAPAGIRLTFEQAEQIAKALGLTVGDDTPKES